MNITATDERSIEVLASGLQVHHGTQLVVGITLRSAVTAQGEACHLVVVGIETGGCWSEESMGFIETLAGSLGA